MRPLPCVTDTGSIADIFLADNGTMIGNGELLYRRVLVSCLPWHGQDHVLQIVDETSLFKQSFNFIVRNKNYSQVTVHALTQCLNSNI